MDHHNFWEFRKLWKHSFEKTSLRWIAPNCAQGLLWDANASQLHALHANNYSPLALQTEFVVVGQVQLHSTLLGYFHTQVVHLKCYWGDQMWLSRCSCELRANPHAPV